MPEHKFAVGQMVSFSPDHGQLGADGAGEATRSFACCPKLPTCFIIGTGYSASLTATNAWSARISSPELLPALAGRTVSLGRGRWLGRVRFMAKLGRPFLPI